MKGRTDARGQTGTHRDAIMMAPGAGRGSAMYQALVDGASNIRPLYTKPYVPDDPGRRRSGRKVLIVDDQPDALLSTVELFQMMGFEALQADSGDAAIKILSATPDIQVLFTDVFMPCMDGVRLGREARKLIPGINVILVSGSPASAMELHAGEPGEFHFLMKPFLMSEVAIVLRR
jgi:CheY-like chemotaxis protein